MTQVVTVFGGSGFVGKHVVRALARQGWRVRVAVRRPTHAYDLRLQGDVGQIQVVRCDVKRESDIARALDGVDAVVNLVGIMYQGLSQSFESVNRQASDAVARLAAARGIRSFVQVSAVGAATNASSSYYASKGRAEEAVKKAIPEAVVLRPSVIFGPQDSFFTNLAMQIKTLPVMPAVGGGHTKFQPVYVADVAAAVARTVGNTKAFGQTYELGGPEVFEFRDLIRYTAQEIMCPRPLVYLPFAAASFIGLFGNLLSVTPITPPLTSDQVLMLQKDNMVAKGAKGLKDLGIAATAIESIVPTYLWRFRKNGQFAVAA
ncbi:MAG: complex I NDUFA9 subunit family protein [Asticcacaulis sp.]|nr:complex I NDUFA9 subunit family protein [Asticcacaulis sp.]